MATNGLSPAQTTIQTIIRDTLKELIQTSGLAHYEVANMAMTEILKVYQEYLGVAGTMLIMSRFLTGYGETIFTNGTSNIFDPMKKELSKIHIKKEKDKA